MPHFLLAGKQVMSPSLFRRCRIQAGRCEVTCPRPLSLQAAGPSHRPPLDPEFFAVAVRSEIPSTPNP